ncbi:MAG: hypothetical protein MUE85_24075 [Microscillaceae bacterium]|nr:hypothetical protein [Microscillaceae bacterium]
MGAISGSRQRQKPRSHPTLPSVWLANHTLRRAVGRERRRGLLRPARNSLVYFPPAFISQTKLNHFYQ